MESSMRKSTLLILGAAMAAGLAARPAMADVHQIGSVHIANDHFTDVSWEHFEGPVQKLQFVASGDTLDCAHISVTYRDGTTHEVFSGTRPRIPPRPLPSRKATAACGMWISPARPRMWMARAWPCRRCPTVGIRAGGRASRMSPPMRAAW